MCVRSNVCQKYYNFDGFSICFGTFSCYFSSGLINLPSSAGASTNCMTKFKLITEISKLVFLKHILGHLYCARLQMINKVILKLCVDKFKFIATL